MKKFLLSFTLSAFAFSMMAQVTNYSVGQVVANFTVTDTDGNQHTLHDITASGKYVMLDFFFDTCPPCQATQTYYNELHQTYGCNAGQLYVLSINNGTDSDAEVIAFENTYGGPWVHAPAISAQGGGGAVTSQFGIAAYPTYCLIGPDNKLVNADIWPISNMSTFVNAFPANSGIQPMACSTSVNETEAVEVVIFPVPASDMLNVNITSESAVYTIFDQSGRAVLSGNMTSSRSEIALKGLSNGIYFLELVSGNEVIRKQFPVVK
jgi:thiol-disulfide isomerase/thioredoxin